MATEIWSSQLVPGTAHCDRVAVPTEMPTEIWSSQLERGRRKEKKEQKDKKEKQITPIKSTRSTHATPLRYFAIYTFIWFLSGFLSGSL